MLRGCVPLTLSLSLMISVVATFVEAQMNKVEPQASPLIFNTIHSFTGGSDGGAPFAGVTMDRAGNLYGTTLEGGTGLRGTVFELKYMASGRVLVPLYDFMGGSDGAGPYARVIIGPDGSLYGTTSGGGEGPCDDFFAGCGIVFNLRPPARACKSALCPWTETVLYRFTGGSDGGQPTGDLIFDLTGNLYGTTLDGGAYHEGTAYKLTPSSGGWTQTVLYSFKQGTDGQGPRGGLIFDRLGNLYGTTVQGGLYGQGTVFELIDSGSAWTEKILYHFSREGDGSSPIGGLIFDTAGDIYGTTSDGGSNGRGTTFELIPQPSGNWTFKLLYSFLGTGSCGFGTPGPQADLIMDTAANLYGTTNCDGAYGYGSAFELSPVHGEWAYTALYDFNNNDGGVHPYGSLVLDSNGDVYGTASGGGCCGYGTVFEITP